MSPVNGFNAWIGWVLRLIKEIDVMQPYDICCGLISIDSLCTFPIHHVVLVVHVYVSTYINCTDMKLVPIGG